MRKQGHWKGKRGCVECEGRGTLVTGMRSVFNARNMELFDVEVLSPCMCAEYVERDPEE